MIYAVVGAFVVSLLALGVSVGAVLQLANRLQDTPQPEDHSDLYRRLDALEDTVDTLPHKWDEFEKSVARREARVRQVVYRARQELEERGLVDPGIEAEAGELLGVDGEGGGNGEVQQVREAVEAPQTAPASEEDWDTLTKRKKYGIV